MRKLFALITTLLLAQAFFSVGCTSGDEFNPTEEDIAALKLSNIVYGHMTRNTPLRWSGKPDEFFSDSQSIDLISAIANEDIHQIGILIKDGTDINVQGKYGVSPLLWAMCMKKKKVYDFLLQHGADSTLSTNHGFPCLHFAAMNGFDSFWLETALKHGANPNSQIQMSNGAAIPKGATPLYTAILPEGSSRRNVQLLIDAGADLNLRVKPDFFPDQLTCPVQQAAIFNRYDFLYQLLEAGAKYRPDPKKGIDIYYHAVRSIHLGQETELGKWRLKVIDFLKKKGVDLPPTIQKIYNERNNDTLFKARALEDPVMGPWIREMD